MNTNQQRAEFLLVGKSLQITSAWRQWSSHGWGERLTEEHMRWDITTWPVTTTQLTCAKNNSSASRNKDCIVLCTAERSCCFSEELQDWSSLKEAGESRTKAAQCCQLCLYCSTLIKTISEEPSLRLQSEEWHVSALMLTRVYEMGWLLKGEEHKPGTSNENVQASTWSYVHKQSGGL